MITADTARVLVVDDHRINRLLLEKRLEQEGYEVTPATGGKEALDLIAASDREEEGALPPFDAVVLDIMMPDIDGIDVLRQIRKAHPPETLPVIMATAKDESEDIVGALELGANDYVTKPVDIPVLLARLHTQIKFRRTHIALQHAQGSLIDAAKMESLGRLAAGVAHEVKNPLYVLQMGVDYFLLTTDPEDETAAKTLHNMQNAVDRANTIIRGMVDFSRSEELKLVDADLNELVEHALVLVGHEINDRKIDLERDLADGMPPVPLDRTKIEQVMINLLSNACQAMGEGGHLRVSTRLLDPGEIEAASAGPRAGRLLEFERGVMIEVADDGPGIPEAFTLKLFDPFFTSKPAGQGTGLGLSVTKTIVDLHGGHIEIANTEPRGARARVYLDAGNHHQALDSDATDRSQFEAEGI